MTAYTRVLGHGLACPVGLTTDTALSAMHAGIKRIVEPERVQDSLGDFARGSMLSQLDPGTSRTDRALYMARFALAEACAPLTSSGIKTVPCFLALPSHDSSPPLDVSVILRQLANVLRERSAVSLEIRQEWLFARGRAAAFFALNTAIAALAGGECEAALVGGLDSQVDPATLSSLSEKNRILCPGNPDGLIPGEGAAFLLLGSMQTDSTIKAVHITSCAIASEPNPRGFDAPYVGLGLTALFRELRQDHTARADVVISAQTGESAFERAFAYAYLRNTALMPEPLRSTVMGALIGDAGAAAGAMAMVAAVAGLRPPRALPRRPPRHASALVYGESDDGPVGGCIVEP
jgi:3-oxoacyl-[acyl-carrier-protein] synthase-1